MNSHNEHLGGSGSPLGTDWVPRDPSMYAASEHYTDRAESDERIVCDRLAAEAIKNGNVEPSTRGKWLFAHKGKGFELRLVAGLDDTNAGHLVPSLVTGYCRVYDLAPVIDRFGERKAKAELLRFVVSGGSDWQRIQALDIRNPVSVKAHRVTTVAGSQSVICTDCSAEFRSWAGIGQDCR